MKNAEQITLITGNTDLFIDRALEKLSASLTAHNPELEKKVIFGTDEDSYIQIIDAFSPNLFGSSSIVVVDGINVAEDKLDEKFVMFVKNIQNEDLADNFIVIIHRGGTGGTGIVKALQKVKVNEIKCENISHSQDFLNFMSMEFKKNKKTIDDDALVALRDAIGENLEELAAAISQLCFDVVDQKITLDSVQKYFQGNAAVKVFDISNAIWNADTELALKRLNELLEQDSNSGIFIVSVIAGSLRKLVKLAGVPSSASEVQIAQEVGIKPGQAKYLKQQLRHWNQTTLANSVVELAKVDAFMRAGFEGVYLDNNQKRFLLETTIRKIGALSR
jgi:DNA polymerase-3 subunit delta